MRKSRILNRFFAFTAIFISLIMFVNFAVPEKYDKYNFISEQAYANASWILPATAGGVATINAIIEAIAGGTIVVGGAVVGGLATVLGACIVIIAILAICNIDFEDVDEMISFLSYCMGELDGWRMQTLSQCADIGLNVGDNLYGIRVNVEKIVASGLIDIICDLYNAWYLAEYGPQYDTGYGELNDLLGAIGAPSLPSEYSALFSKGFCFFVYIGYGSSSYPYQFVCTDYNNSQALVIDSNVLQFRDFTERYSFSWHPEKTDSWTSLSPSISGTGMNSYTIKLLQNGLLWANRNIYDEAGNLIYDSPFDDSSYVGSNVTVDDFLESIGNTNVDSNGCVVVGADSAISGISGSDIPFLENPEAFAPIALPLPDVATPDNPFDNIEVPSVGEGGLLDVFTNFWDKLKEYFNALATAIATAIGTTLIGSTYNLDYTGLKSGAKSLITVFPFCIPFDIISMFGLLSAPAEVPVFTIDLSDVEPFNTLSKDFIIVIEFSRFEGIIKLIKGFELLLFAIGLAFLTRGLVRG